MCCNRWGVCGVYIVIGAVLLGEMFCGRWDVNGVSVVIDGVLLWDLLE